MHCTCTYLCIHVHVRVLHVHVSCDCLQMHACTPTAYMYTQYSRRSVHKPSRSRQDAGRKAVPGERICGDVLRRCPDGDLVLRQLPESQPRRVYSLRRASQSKRTGLQRVVLAQSHTEQDILCLSHRPVSGESDFCTKFLY